MGKYLVGDWIFFWRNRNHRLVRDGVMETPLQRWATFKEWSLAGSQIFMGGFIGTLGASLALWMLSWF